MISVHADSKILIQNHGQEWSLTMDMMDGQIKVESLCGNEN